MPKKDPQAEIAEHITEDPDVLKEDQPCPICGKQAYVGFTNVECPTRGCPNYSKKQEEIVYGKGGPSTSIVTWQDISANFANSGYCPTNGGRVWMTKFMAQEPIPLLDIAGYRPLPQVEIGYGPVQIQVESRYGYVDAWINDEHQIEHDIVFAPNFNKQRGYRYTPQDENARDRAIEAMKNTIEEWIAGLYAQGKISI